MSGLRDLPSVDSLAGSVELARFPSAVRVQAARSAVETLRALIKSGANGTLPNPVELAIFAAEGLDRQSLRRVINASGVILHTGAGRARLAQAAVEAVQDVASGHASLELDLDTGRRGNRQDH